jgi:DNA transformation protein and related proteins
MTANQSHFVEHCKELLGSIGNVRSRRMFGGHGLYVDDVFLAIVFDDRLYLKVDAQTRSAFEAASCLPFVYGSAGASVSLSYFCAPDEATESPALMLPWARLALDAALRAKAAKPSAARAAKKANPRKGSAKTAPTKL